MRRRNINKRVFELLGQVLDDLVVKHGGVQLIDARRHRQQVEGRQRAPAAPQQG